MLDPNAKKNRVPGPDEVATLRDLVQRNEQMVQDLEKHIKEGNGTRSSLKKRYQDLIESTECTQSEIVAVEHSLAMFNNQKSLIEANQKRLRGLLHPIRRCPSDVLQLIFELAVETDDNWFGCATTLSHVCRQWRRAAIETARLWVDINVSSDAKWESVRDFWSRTTKRVKAAPAYVIISVTGTTDAHLKALRQCRLDQLPHIEHLEFCIHTNNEAAFLTSDSLRFPREKVDHLQLDGEGAQELTIDINSISRRLPPTNSLSIISVSHIQELPRVVSIPTVTRLLLKDVTRTSLRHLCLAFPNVETATFIRTTFYELPQDLTVSTWPNLKDLIVLECPSMPWGRLRANDITKLSCGDPITEHFLAFIDSHKSIKSLDISYDGGHIYSVATSAPQLCSLTIDACEEIVNKTRMKLNKLTYLGIYDCVDPSLSLDLFEKIVRSRFLPKKGRRQSTKAEPLSLEILVRGESAKDLEWEESELIRSAQQEVFTVDRWEDTWTVYSFRWE